MKPILLALLAIVTLMAVAPPVAAQESKAINLALVVVSTTTDSPPLRATIDCRIEIYIGVMNNPASADKDSGNMAQFARLAKGYYDGLEKQVPDDLKPSGFFYVGSKFPS